MHPTLVSGLLPTPIHAADATPADLAVLLEADLPLAQDTPLPFAAIYETGITPPAQMPQLALDPTQINPDQIETPQPAETPLPDKGDVPQQGEPKGSASVAPAESTLTPVLTNGDKEPRQRLVEQPPATLPGKQTHPFPAKVDPTAQKPLGQPAPDFNPQTATATKSELQHATLHRPAHAAEPELNRTQPVVPPSPDQPPAQATRLKVPLVQPILSAQPQPPKVPQEINQVTSPLPPQPSPRAEPPQLQMPTATAVPMIPIATPNPTLAPAPTGFQKTGMDAAHDPSRITPILTEADSHPLSRHDTQSSTAPLQSHLATPRLDLPQHVARQIADAIQQMPNRPVEISLNPEELGRVRLGLTTSEAGLIVHILAERPETMELMRRHINNLESAFAAIGYSDIAFSFGGNGNDQADRPKDGQDHPDTSLETGTLPQSGNATQIRLASPSVTGLDLRL